MAKVATVLNSPVLKTAFCSRMFRGANLSPEEGRERYIKGQARDVRGRGTLGGSNDSSGRDPVKRFGEGISYGVYGSS
jgi:hypothetical protein